MDRWTDGQMDRWIDGFIGRSVYIYILIIIYRDVCKYLFHLYINPLPLGSPKIAIPFVTKTRTVGRRKVRKPELPQRDIPVGNPSRIQP